MDAMTGRGVWLWLMLHLDELNIVWGTEMQWYDCLPFTEAEKEALCRGLVSK